jgi:DNA-binding NtrC family response regulator
MPIKLLVIDDDPASCRLMRAIFAAEDFAVQFANDGESGVALAAEQRPEVVVLDLQLPGIDGLETLERLRAGDPLLPVVMLTAHAELKSAVRATQLGAFDYLTKPVDADEVVLVVRRALETLALKTEIRDLRRQVEESSGLAHLMGPGPEVARVVEQVQLVASTSFSVLVLGQTGTGKELVAQALHRQSERRNKPFIALDCGAIPEALLESELFGHEKGAFTGAIRGKQGRFELADGGTFFLDEVGNLPLGLQAKLLRVLESREFQALGAARAKQTDIRFIAATNEDLQERATLGKFRPDLYFRLAQYTIALPALRTRPGDIRYLAQRFLDEVSVELRRPVRQIAPDALLALERHTWPGNVRELRNVVRQAVLESKELVLQRSGVQKLLKESSASTQGDSVATAGLSLREVADQAARAAERQAITETLRATQGNKAQSARSLRTDYKTLHLKMKALGLRARDFAP